MTEQANIASPPENTPQSPPRRRSRGRTAVFAVLIAGASALTGAIAANAFGGGPGGWHGPGGWGGPGWHGRGFMRQIDPARAEARADRMVRHLAVEVDATAAQQEKLRSVVKGLVKDVLPLREQAQKARQQARTLLTQPNLDRATIEAFRTEQMALADRFTKRLAQALADAAEILTPEQRKKLGEILPPHRRGFWRGQNRG